MERKLSASDKKLIQISRKDRADSWSVLHAQFDPLIESIVRWPKWNFTEDEQRDVSQNIHVQLQSALPKFREQCSLKWFVKRIAMNQCIDEIRRQKKWRTFMTPLTQQKTDGTWNEMELANFAAPDPSDEAEQNERRQCLYTALSQLHDTCRQSISMHYLKHMSYKDMAAQLGISVNTVGSRLNKCLDKLQKEMRKQPLFERTER
ncbi:MAG: sigma-70 family RNA polymerase sigma factor [Pontiellaceae bacterium]|nr:sigma-70 family RNA polymerase sigma factor [Pontiellaceae bacterium]MBN2783681.1 sigma-70 family RNA polymerase sigma factor [Pontiellaceae bacterium]